MPMYDVSHFNFLNFTLGQPSAAEQAAQAAAPIAAVAAVSPPPLFMFPPQGAPQPGAVAAGGGITPVVALAVRKRDFHFSVKIFCMDFLQSL